MGIYETFSKRRKKIDKQDMPDGYRYDVLPKEFRVQVINICKGALGSGYDSRGYEDGESQGRWRTVQDILAHELGVFSLGEKNDSAYQQCTEFLLNAPPENALDLIELCFRMIMLRQEKSAYAPEKERFEEAIRELNYRFKEHGIGYQFEHGNLLRIDSQYIHAEVVKPAIALIHQAGFSGPSEEFLQAHEHYRSQRYPEAIAGALKAFESTMKGICDSRKWKYPDNVTAKGLIEVILSNELIPSSLASQFSGLRAVLESGLPTVRNKQGGHGQGKDHVAIPSYLAAYALHLSASNIVMLVEAYKALK